MDAQHLDKLLMIMIGIFGFAVFFNAVALVVAAVFMNKGLKAAREYCDEVRTKVEPLLDSSHELVQQTRALMVRLEPKLETAADDLADITRTVREETKRFSASVDEVTGRMRRQAERVDEMTTSTLNTVDKVGHFLNEAVSAPVRQISGVVAAARAVITSLRAPAPPRQSDSEERIREERQNYV
jgi:uncharacterized protein YoxC